MYFYECEIDSIGIAEKAGKITNVYLPNASVPEDIQISETPLLQEAGKQLKSYLAGTLTVFSLPLATLGTPFMQQVLACVCEIPYGSTATYKEIAIKIGSPKAARAVGLANQRNKVPIFIPCHRVIGTNGTLTGYRGGIELKKKLLDLENIYSRY